MTTQLLKNDTLIRALLREPVPYTPIWLMRQAGRYLPEYRQLRAQFPDFMAFCQTPKMACEATLQPLRRFPLDAAILFSDILTIPHAMGVGVEFMVGEGPIIQNPISNQDDVERLPILSAQNDLAYVMEAIERIKTSLAGEVPLIGFAGSPWTLACYMIEGGGSKTFSRPRSFVYQNPALLMALLSKLADATADYLHAQIKAGVDVIMIFDTWGGLLSASAYQVFSLSYMQSILKRLPTHYQGRRIPKIIFTKGGGLWLEQMAETKADALGLDWSTSIGAARRRVGEKMALQGNLDPMALMGTSEHLEKTIVSILEDYGPGTGHVFNLGHGIDQHTDYNKVGYLVKRVHELSQI